ncbi:uncharacterized protein LOC8268001 [Ricinus communis]|uniref:uncharacterized protein LOC8268001 n=1 Tax=Ricinus communis TaxID=3988 RepID=UPI00201ABBE0|nr:uncharacterized protein LOC8268001 [Ricinus communis]
MTLKPLTSKTLLFLSPSSSSPFPFCSVIVSHFCTSSSAPTHSPRPWRQRHTEESRNVKVSVWWDFENCNLPTGVNVFKVAHAITAALRANGIKGPVQITAFGDVFQLSRANQEALSSTGINLAHVPHGGKNSADRSLLVDLMYWVSQNPPPAHLFLISGDRDFASILHRLRMINYNVLLASNDTAPSVLCSAASIMWRWNTLVRGENLIGKVFNQPPDGPYGSWYGHYKVPLENPFEVEQTTFPQGEELTEASLETKFRPIPRTVMKRIRDVLSLYPKGISIHELRSELGKSDIGIDKDLYGYKKFFRFLLSMPNILKLHTASDGQLIARGIITKPEPFDPNPCMSTGPIIGDGNQCLTKSIKPKGENLPVSASGDPKLLVPTSPELSTEGSARKHQKSPPIEKAVKMDIGQPPKEMGESHSVGEENVEVINTQVLRENLPPVKGQDTKSDVGFFKTFWRRWFGSIDDSSVINGYDISHPIHTSQNNSEKKSENTLETCGASIDTSEKKEAEKFAESPNQGNCPKISISCSLSNNESTLGTETTMSSEPHSEKSEKSPGSINHTKELLWENGVNSNSLADQPSGELNKLKDINSHSGIHKMFCDDSFWRDMQSFFNSQRGSLVVSQSRTREQMAKNLQKDGPLALRSLNESNILQLVDMLISEKKWVEEHLSEASPFRITESVGKDTSLGVCCSSNGLRSISLSTQLESSSKRQTECDGDGRIGKTSNVSHAGVSQRGSCKKPSERSRKKILVDCQKLVKEILKEFPEGYNISSFRKLFLEKYGYHLHVQKFGYQKLTSLLQIMPGVKIESTYIIPANKATKCSIQDSDVPNIQESNVSDTSKALGGELSDESDSGWDKLGPVDNSSSRRKEQEEQCLGSPHYEPSLSEDDFSDPEGESWTATQQEGQAKYRVNTEDSSLLQILDLWYSSSDGVNEKDKSENVQDMVNCDLQLSDLSGLDTEIGTSLGNSGSKQRPQKCYSFVAAPDGDDHGDNASDANKTNQLIDGDDHGDNASDANKTNQLIDGILGSLKKSSETGVQS